MKKVPLDSRSLRDPVRLFVLLAKPFQQFALHQRNASADDRQTETKTETRVFNPIDKSSIFRLCCCSSSAGAGASAGKCNIFMCWQLASDCETVGDHQRLHHLPNRQQDDNMWFVVVVDDFTKNRDLSPVVTPMLTTGQQWCRSSGLATTIRVSRRS